MLDKIDRTEDHERKKELRKRIKAESKARKIEHQKATKLSSLLQKRKEALKRELMKKRDFLERDLLLELQQSGKNKRRHTSPERMPSQSTPEAPKAKKKKIDEERLFCVCKKPYDPTQ